MSCDSSFQCEIKRSERPCLVCTGHMDLVEARPRKFNLFGGIPLVCSSEGVDCLDCPKCGFKTTTADYEYLRMCKKDRTGRGMFIDTTMNSIGEPRTRSKRVIIERTCQSCKTSLESNSWQYCPGCGIKCSPSLSTSTSATSLSTPATPKEIEIVITNTVSKDPVIIEDANSITMTDSERIRCSFDGLSASNSTESGIVRMVTPPKDKRTTSMNGDFSSPVKMQY